MKLGKIVEQHVQLYLADDDSLRSIRLRDNAQNMKFSIKNFFSKCDQIRSFLRIWSHLPKKFIMDNFIFWALIKVTLDNVTLSGLSNKPTCFKYLENPNGIRSYSDKFKAPLNEN